MNRLHIDPEYKALLASKDLVSYAQFMSTTAGELLDEEERRDIQKLRLNDETFFLKRTRFEKISSALESYLSGKLPHSKPYKEMLQIRFLRESGFNAAHVIATGEELRFGIPVAGFILTREATGVDLSHKHRDANATERADILAQLGVLSAQLHRAGFFLSVRLKDVFWNQSSGQSPVLTLIDREARNPSPKRFSSTRARESLHTSLRRHVRADGNISAVELKHFARAYCAELVGTWDIKPSKLFRMIRGIAGKLASPS